MTTDSDLPKSAILISNTREDDGLTNLLCMSLMTAGYEIKRPGKCWIIVQQPGIQAELQIETGDPDNAGMMHCIPLDDSRHDDGYYPLEPHRVAVNRCPLEKTGIEYAIGFIGLVFDDILKRQGIAPDNAIMA